MATKKSKAKPILSEINLKLKFNKEFIEAISVKGVPSVKKLIDLFNESEAMNDEALTLCNITLMDGSTHLMLNNANSCMTEIKGDDDVNGVIDYLFKNYTTAMAYIFYTSMSDKYELLENNWFTL